MARSIPGQSPQERLNGSSVFSFIRRSEEKTGTCPHPDLEENNQVSSFPAE